MINSRIIIVCLLSAFSIHAYAEDTPVLFTVLHTNDHHGRFWPNNHGEYGMPARKTLIDKIRHEVRVRGGHVLLLSGGDINTGVPESDLLDAEPDFIGMNIIGYDAMALGNHEFDNKLDVIRKQENWANFSFLSANVYSSESGIRLFKPYQVFEFDKLRIAVIGLTTDDSANISNLDYVDHYLFKSPIEEAASLVPELKQQFDLVFVVSHMGHYPDGRHTVNAPGDVSLARQVDDIDLIVGGHSQDPVCMEQANSRKKDYRPGDDCVPDRQNGTWIVQAAQWGRYVGRADFTYSQGILELLDYQLIPVNLKYAYGNKGEKITLANLPDIEEDLHLKHTLKHYLDKGSEQLSRVIGHTRVRLEGRGSITQFQKTNLGRLILDAQMNISRADIAILNAGGIRNSIEAGEIRIKDVLGVHPFGNFICYVDMSGRELKDYLALIVAVPEDTGGFAHINGADFTLEKGSIKNLYIHGNDKKKVDDNDVYRLTINSFLAAGGDKYPVITNHPTFVNTGLVDASVLTDYISRLQTINPGLH